MQRKNKLSMTMALALAALVVTAGFGPGAQGTGTRPASVQAQATPVPIPGDGSQTFPETGKSVRGLFLDYWHNNGGLPQQGYPISGEMQEKSDLDGKSYTVQYFERAVFEYHPENQAPFNVLLSQLGTVRFKGKYPQGEPGGAALTLPASAARTPCVATHNDGDGSTYEPNAPFRNSVGKGHIVRGFVLSSAGCMPIAGAKVELWPDVGGGHDPNDRATVLADKAGAYWYESRPPDHIHMRISAHGYKTIFSNLYHPPSGQAEGKFDIVLVPDSECQVFQETGKAVCGTFLDYWKAHGGLPQQGYPISGEFQEKSELDDKPYTVQYFERAVFEAHPENEAPYDVLLSQLGTFAYKAKYAGGGQLPANLSLNDFYEQVFLNLLLRDPDAFTSVGLPDSFKPDYRHNKLTDVHDTYLRETYALVKQYLERLKSYDPKTQTAQQAVSTSIMAWHLDDVARGQEFMYHDYIVNPVIGAQINTQDLMVNLHPLSNKQNAEDYVARLGEYGRKFDGVLEQLRLREQKGIFPPRWMIEYTIGQMQGFVSDEAKQNELYTYLKTRLDVLSSVSPADKQALLASAEKAIKESVYPAYNLVIDLLESILPKGRTTDGVWGLPNGDAYYRYAIHHYTTTDMTPDEIHTLGLKEVTRVKGEMQVILDGLGYDGLSFSQAMAKVAEASGVYQMNTQAGKQQVLDAFKAVIAEADKNVTSQFDIKPKVGVEVRAVPVEKQAGAAGGFYFAPALDGSRPGIFYVNLGRPNFPKYQIPTLAYHEAIPGHHFQLGIQTELKSVPTFQRSGIFPPSTGYTEGWALYAEQLAYEAGFYKNDPYGNLGRLQAELFRSARLVVDTGIHSKKWTQQQANKYMDDTLGQSPGAYNGEIVRYIAWPGQALGYKIGQLKILELKEHAKKELGAKFNIKEFHNVLLQNGTVPLEVLETLVDRYIASKK